MKNKLIVAIITACISIFSLSPPAEAKPLHGKRVKKIVKTKKGGRTVIIKKYRRGKIITIRKNKKGRTRTIVPTRGRRTCGTPSRHQRQRR